MCRSDAEEMCRNRTLPRQRLPQWSRFQHAEEEERTAPKNALGTRATRVFQSVQRMCEWRLGRALFPGDGEMPEAVIPVSRLVRCLREVQKSIPRWSQRGGRKGYLDFISEFLP
jgi:hypothetical protein